MDKSSKILVLGGSGMVGSAIVRELKRLRFRKILAPTHRELELEYQKTVMAYFKLERPEYVFLAAAKVGGIGANTAKPADFIRSNLAIQCNLIEAAHANSIFKLLFTGSSCIYPRDCPQPIKEEYLLTAPLESTNEPYAIAKIAGIRMCQAYNRQYGSNFISVMPTNLYGPGDSYDKDDCHVLPAMIRRFHEAKQMKSPTVEIWGTGRPLREFLYVDDLAKACVFLMQSYNDPAHINIGSGQEISIMALARLVARIVGYRGMITTDPSKPDGTPRKLLDSSKINRLGWKATTSLENGIRLAYKDYLSRAKARVVG